MQSAFNNADLIISFHSLTITALHNKGLPLLPSPSFSTHHFYSNPNHKPRRHLPHKKVDNHYIQANELNTYKSTREEIALARQYTDSNNKSSGTTTGSYVLFHDDITEISINIIICDKMHSTLAGNASPRECGRAGEVDFSAMV